MISQIYKDLSIKPLFLQNRVDELSKIFRKWNSLYVHILQEKVSKKTKIYKEVLIVTEIGIIWWLCGKIVVQKREHKKHVVVIAP